MLKLAGNQIGGNLKYREPMLGTVAELLHSSVEQVKINIARGEFDPATNKGGHGADRKR